MRKRVPVGRQERVADSEGFGDQGGATRTVGILAPMGGRGRLAGRILAGLAVVLGAAYILTLGRGSTYALDEWVFVVDRHSFSWDAVFSHHNSHPSIFPALIYISVFRLVGLDHPEIFRVIVFMGHFFIAVTVALLVRRRHGEQLALLAGVLVLLSGSGAANIVWGFQIGFCLSVGMYLASYLLLLRGQDSGGNAAAIGASATLVVAALSSGVGVAAICAMCVAVAVSSSRRSLWWVPIPAILSFAIWYLAFGDDSSQVTLATVPAWMWNSALASGAAFLGSAPVWGALIIVPIAVFGFVQAWRRRLSTPFLVHSSFLLAFWVSTGLGRSLFTDPGPSRYLHVASSSLVLLICLMLPQRCSRATKPMVAAGLLVTASILVQSPDFRQRMTEQQLKMRGGAHMRGSIAMVELLEGKIKDDGAVVPFLGVPLVTVGEYLRAVHEVGDSPAYPWAMIPRAPEKVREGADFALNELNTVAVSSRAAEGCTTESPAISMITLRGGDEAIVRSAENMSIIVRRFRADEWSVTTWRSLGGGTLAVQVPVDALDVPWQVHFRRPVAQLSCTDA